MVYLFGEGAENRAYDVLVDTTEGGKLEILSKFSKDRIVDLIWFGKPMYFEEVAQSILGGYTPDVTVLFTEKAGRAIATFANKNRRLYGATHAPVV